MSHGRPSESTIETAEGDTRSIQFVPAHKDSMFTALMPEFKDDPSLMLELWEDEDRQLMQLPVSDAAQRENANARYPRDGNEENIGSVGRHCFSH